MDKEVLDVLKDITFILERMDDRLVELERDSHLGVHWGESQYRDISEIRNQIYQITVNKGDK